MALLAILDTNVLIRLLRNGRGEDYEDASRRYLVRHSAVVLSELYRGASDPVSRRAVDGVVNGATRIWAPSSDDWLHAGKLVRVLGDRQGYDVHKRRELQNDCLIALTARRHGAVVLTGDTADFRRIAEHTGTRVEEM